MGCQILDEHGNLIAVERASAEYTIRINADLDSEDFGSHTMNKFVLYKFQGCTINICRCNKDRSHIKDNGDS